MKALFASLAPRKAIGIYVGDQEITVSRVAATPLGPVEIARRSLPYTADQLTPVLQRLLAELTGRRKRRRALLALGLPAPRVFFSTRPIRTANTEASAQVLLHEVLQSPSICIDDMAVDLIKAQPDRRRVASIVSCRRKYLTGLLTGLEGCGVRLVRAEPAPCALLRVACRQQRAPRKSKAVLRLFLGQEQGLGMVVVDDLPLVWRFFPLPAGEEGAALCSVTRSLQAVIVQCGVDSALDTVILHGRDDLRSSVDAGTLEQQLQIRTWWVPEPGLDNAAIAFGLALGCLNQQAETFDLARFLKPPASLRDIFPWGELAVQAALLLCMGLFLNFSGQHSHRAYAAVQAESTQHAWLATAADERLEKEHNDLLQKVEAVRGFVSSRILWTSYTQDIAARLPDNASLESFQGLCELPVARKPGEAGSPPKRSLVLRLNAPIPPDGSVPQEIDGFLGSLRGHPLLKRDFPLVKLADIKWAQSYTGSKPMALFTVVCLPAAEHIPSRQAKEKGSANGVEK